MTTAIVNQMLNAIHFGNIPKINSLKKNFPEQIEHIDYYIGLLERRAILQAPNRQSMSEAVWGLYALSALSIAVCIVAVIMRIGSSIRASSYLTSDIASEITFPILLGVGILSAIATFIIANNLVSQHYKNQYIQDSFLHKLLLFNEEVSTQDMQALEQNIMQCKAALTEEIKQFLPKA